MSSQKKPTSRQLILAVTVIIVVLAGIGFCYCMPTGTVTTSTYTSQIASELQGVPNPDTFVYQTPDEADALDPAWDYEVAGGAALELVHERPLFHDRDKLDIVPELAERYEVSSDGLVYTFHIRRDVKFRTHLPPQKW